jgi:hypothetical protein
VPFAISGRERMLRDVTSRMAQSRPSDIETSSKRER